MWLSNRGEEEEARVELAIGQEFEEVDGSGADTGSVEKQRREFGKVWRVEYKSFVSEPS